MGRKRKNEWIEDSGIISRQAEYSAKNNLGIAIYSYDSAFSEKLAGELLYIAEIIKNITAVNSHEKKQKNHPQT